MRRRPRQRREAQIDGDPAQCGACGHACGPGESCGGVCAAPPVVGDGSLAAGTDLFYQYSSIAAGSSVIKANWTAVVNAQSYEVAVGTTAGAEDVAAFADAGNVTSKSVTGLSLQGAWAGLATYYVTVRAVCAAGKGAPASSNGVRVAEAVSYDGSTVTCARPTPSAGTRTTGPRSG
ncbi:MAG: hypothetical protein U0359_08055 [Byssovorax sp.]